MLKWVIESPGPYIGGYREDMKVYLEENGNGWDIFKVDGQEITDEGYGPFDTAEDAIIMSERYFPIEFLPEGTMPSPGDRVVCKQDEDFSGVIGTVDSVSSESAEVILDARNPHGIRPGDNIMIRTFPFDQIKIVHKSI